MTKDELRKKLNDLSDEEFHKFITDFGGEPRSREQFVREYAQDPKHERRICYLLGLIPQEERLVGINRTVSIATCISAGAAFVAVFLTIFNLSLGPLITKSKKANEIRMVYREYARHNIMNFFNDYENWVNVLNDFPHGILQSVSSAEEVDTLTEIIKENLGSLKPKEILAVSIVLNKENQMVSRRRRLNNRMEEIRAKTILDSSAKITNELQDMKAAIESYLKRQIEFNF